MSTNNSDFKERYEIKEKLGGSGNTSVYRYFDKSTRDSVAIKRIIKSRTENRKDVEREISILKSLKSLNHSNIISFIENFQIKNEIRREEYYYIIFELAKMDLSKKIQEHRQKKFSMPLEQIKIIMYNIIQGVKVLHSQRIIHRDIKSKNILITEKGDIKIADFGISKQMDSYNEKQQKWHTPDQITIGYRPLEMLLGQTNYTEIVDIFSVGCIFAELCLLDVFLSKSDDVNKQIEAIIRKFGLPTGLKGFDKYKNIAPKRQYNFEHHFPQLSKKSEKGHGIDLISRMLEINPLQRITAQQCLEHPFFKYTKSMEKEESQRKMNENIYDQIQFEGNEYRYIKMQKNQKKHELFFQIFYGQQKTITKIQNEFKELKFKVKQIKEEKKKIKKEITKDDQEEMERTDFQEKEKNKLGLKEMEEQQQNNNE